MSKGKPLEFTLAPTHADTFPDLDTLLALKLQARGAWSLTQAYYDSFDWRLHRAGLTHMVEYPPARLSYAIAPLVSADWPEQLAAGDYPPSLADVVGVRSLLRQVTLSGERREWLGEAVDGAISLQLDLLMVDTPGHPSALAPRLRLLSEPGFRKQARQLAACMAERFPLHPARESALDEALRLSGRLAENPSAPITVAIEPELRADLALKRILMALLGVLEANTAGVLAATDTEYLHDYRIAVRRSRSVLGQLHGVFPQRQERGYNLNFARLAAATSEARDLDVHLLALTSLESGLPAALRGQFGPLREQLQARAVRAHATLNRRLRSTAHRQFMQGLENYLATPAPHHPSAPHARDPVLPLVSQRIWTLYRRTLKQGAAISDESPASALHDLRKTAKKLRYLIDAFRSLYPPEKLEPLLKKLKKLQSLLGEYQDTGVMLAHLYSVAETLRAGAAPTPTLLALGALLGQLHRREDRLRAAFPECFHGYSTRSQRRKCRHLFGPVGGHGAEKVAD
ncbi:MAG: CHAD domain-containing protein [Methylococcaceae bacterium]|jgi:CHAD domain-containing protein